MEFRKIVKYIAILIIGIVTGTLIPVGGNQSLDKNDVSKDSDITVTESAIALTKCVPKMGFHYADPKTLPRGPIFLTDGSKEVVGIEYLFLESELEEGGGADVENLLSAYNKEFENVSITFMSEGVPDLPMPLYALHMYALTEVERANICDGEELEESHAHEDSSANENLETVTSADNAPSGSIHNLPVPEAVSAVRSLVASELGVGEGVVIVMSAHEKTWTNGCLGLETAEETCTSALVAGYEVVVQAAGKEYTYRTNENGTSIRLQK